MNLSIYGMKLIKKLNIWDYINPGKNIEVEGTWLETLINENNMHDSSKLSQLVNLDIQINDNMEIYVQISNMNSS